jgi:hypothetical protein
MSDRTAVNYGLFVPRNEVKANTGGWFWHGIKCYPTESTDWFVIQDDGARHGWTHVDWSQLGYAVREKETGDKERKPWEDRTKTHGERIVAWMQHELVQGVKETKTNWSPRISEYLKPCMRDGSNIGAYLSKVGAEWCAAFRCAGELAANLPQDVPTGIGYRCSGIELEQDAKACGAWKPVESLLDGNWEPNAGDTAIFTRGSQEWQRHVSTVVSYSNGRFTAIDGNKGNKVSEMKYSSIDPDLIGFIQMPRPNDRLRITDHLLHHMFLPKQ